MCASLKKINNKKYNPIGHRAAKQTKHLLGLDKKQAKDKEVPPPPDATLLTAQTDAAARNPLMQLPSTILSGAEFDYVQAENTKRRAIVAQAGVDEAAKRKSDIGLADDAWAAKLGFSSYESANGYAIGKGYANARDARTDIGDKFNAKDRARFDAERASAAAKKKKATTILTETPTWTGR